MIAAAGSAQSMRSADTPATPRRRRRLLPSECPLAPVFPVLMLLFAAPGPASALEVRVEGERLSADVSQEPVADVLAAVAEQTGAKLTIRGELGKVSRQAFERLPLADGLSRLAQPNGLVLQFVPVDTPSGAPSGMRRLVAIRVVAPSAGGASASANVTPAVTRRDMRRGLPPGFWNYESAPERLPPVAERISALSKLRQQRGGQANAAPYVYVLVTDPDPAARRMALGMLAGIKSDEARGALTQAAADADPAIRADALRALSATGGDKPVTLLAQAGRGDSDLQVRITAIQLLSLKDGPLAEAVIKGALADPDPDIRDAAQQAMRH